MLNFRGKCRAVCLSQVQNVIAVLLLLADDDPREGSRGAVPGTPSPDEARGAARVAVPELTGAAQAAAGPRLGAEPQGPTMTVAAGAEGTSSGNDLTVLAPTSSNEVLVAADERLYTQPSCIPHGRPEPSLVPATARENISVSVLPAPQDGDTREGSRGAVPGTPSPDDARGTARVAVPELTGAAQAAAGPLNQPQRWEYTGVGIG
ncbi:uncharacterized protein LOC133340816 [Lethenteron reissneri]|uniref:uncharacterized protein LOC133340816 n=1 Tax=Lethenteron reissneri TaxID=7753 RepID=UPI002AB7BFE9|nr:uncharacterized protein LOC133340816 [Lethenteron reissneri]